MRKHLRSLLWLLLFASIFPFVFPWKDGKPLLSWSEIRLPEMPTITLPEIPGIAQPDKNTPAREAHQPVVLYLWKGADGSTQYSNELPPKGVAYEVIEVNPDANLIQAPVNPEPAETVRSGEEDRGENSSSLPSPLTVSPAEAMQLLEDARNLREISEQRLHRHEELMQ